MLASVLSGTGLALLLKDWFRRPRPQVVPHLTDISTASFPSGHSMLSSLTYLTLAALLARAVPDLKTKLYFLLVVASVLTLLIGCSRVYLGVHYPDRRARRMVRGQYLGAGVLPGGAFHRLAPCAAKIRGTGGRPAPRRTRAD